MIEEKYSSMKNWSGYFNSYFAERPKLSITYSLTITARKSKYIEILVFFEQEIEDNPMNKRDVFMTLPPIV
jgi:hypothetical protein